MSNALFLLIPATATLVVIFGGILVMKAQKMSAYVGERQAGEAGPTGFQQGADETREAYVRRHWQRPGVVANGETLVDLYDRIAELEERLAGTEERLEALQQR